MKGPTDLGRSDYLALLDQNAWKAKKPQRIGIVGAGISGLLSGWLLRRAGHNVTIFEASKTVGGRIKTLREGFSRGLYAEAGAMRIPESHVLTLHLAENILGLKLEDFQNYCPNSILMFNGERVTRAAYDLNPSSLGYSLGVNEKGLSANRIFDEVLSGYIKSLKGFHDFEMAELLSDQTPTERGRRKQLLEHLDRHSIRTFFTEDARLKGERLSEAAVEMVCNVLSLEMQMHVSLAETVHEHSELHKNEKTFAIVDGMDMLPKSFIGLGNGRRRKESLNVSYSSRVVSIEMLSPGKRQFTITCENPITRKNSDYECDHVIVSIPFSAFRQVETGLLDSKKRRAVRQLQYENSCKIMIEFSSRFWDRVSSTGGKRGKPITGGASSTDFPLRQILYPATKRSDSNEGGILIGYTWGDDSLRWTSLKRDDRIRFALRQIAAIHGMSDRASQDRLEEIFVGGISHSWAEDEFTSGAFANFEPYQMSDLFEDIWRPNDNFHFCGEHTSLKHGWIEGAIESAIRVAQEICTNC